MKKQIDKLGRIVIPKDIRKELDLKENDEVDIHLIDDYIEIIPCRNKSTLYYELRNFEDIIEYYISINEENKIEQDKLKFLLEKIRELKLLEDI